LVITSLLTPMPLLRPLRSTHPPPTTTPTLSLHDALPISAAQHGCLTYIDATQAIGWLPFAADAFDFVSCAGYKWLLSRRSRTRRDRKSTRLNSSHQINSYAVFFLKKKRPPHYS